MVFLRGSSQRHRGPRDEGGLSQGPENLHAVYSDPAGDFVLRDPLSVHGQNYLHVDPAGGLAVVADYRRFASGDPHTASGLSAARPFGIRMDQIVRQEFLYRAFPASHFDGRCHLPPDLRLRHYGGTLFRSAVYGLVVLHCDQVYVQTEHAHPSDSDVHVPFDRPGHLRTAQRGPGFFQKPDGAPGRLSRQ